MKTICLGLLLTTLLANALCRADSLQALSDRFDDPATLSQWQRVRQTEGWSADPLQICDLATTRPGQLIMQPYTCTWYQDYIGDLVYKPVTGDFVFTSTLHITTPDAPNGSAVPQSSYSLGGLMLRAPRAITNPATQWRTGGENYVFLSLGHGDNGLQYEVKTTVNSVSTLQLTPATSNQLTIRWARIGPSLIALIRPPGQQWRIFARYHRPDLPQTLQVGFVTYTDYTKAATYTPEFHNSHTLTPALQPNPSNNPALPFRPDLRAAFEEALFARPAVPPGVAGRNASDPAQLTDAQLLSFLGTPAD